MLMNIHKEETKIMSLAGVANEFAAKIDKRRADFGNNYKLVCYCLENLIIQVNNVGG